jgi:hypothetical protein
VGAVVVADLGLLPMGLAVVVILVVAAAGPVPVGLAAPLAAVLMRRSGAVVPLS